MPAPNPLCPPLELAFPVHPDPLTDPLKAAVSTAGTVHSLCLDGPPIPLIRVTDYTRVFVDARGRPCAGGLARGSWYPVLDAAKLLGSIILALLCGSAEENVLERCEALAEWREAVYQSSSYRFLQDLERDGHVNIPGADGVVLPVDVSAARIATMLLLSRRFECSYAQFVKTWNRQSALAHEFVSAGHDRDTQVYQQFWDPDDFIPISLALEHLFERKGWTIV